MSEELEVLIPPDAPELLAPTDSPEKLQQVELLAPTIMALAYLTFLKDKFNLEPQEDALLVSGIRNIQRGLKLNPYGEELARERMKTYSQQVSIEHDAQVRDLDVVAGMDNVGMGTTLQEAGEMLGYVLWKLQETYGINCISATLHVQKVHVMVYRDSLAQAILRLDPELRKQAEDKGITTGQYASHFVSTILADWRKEHGR